MIRNVIHFLMNLFQILNLFLTKESTNIPIKRLKSSHQTVKGAKAVFHKSTVDNLTSSFCKLITH